MVELKDCWLEQNESEWIGKWAAWQTDRERSRGCRVSLGVSSCAGHGWTIRVQSSVGAGPPAIRMRRAAATNPSESGRQGGVSRLRRLEVAVRDRQPRRSASQHRSSTPSGTQCTHPRERGQCAHSDEKSSPRAFFRTPACGKPTRRCAAPARHITTQGAGQPGKSDTADPSRTSEVRPSVTAATSASIEPRTTEPPSALPPASAPEGRATTAAAEFAQENAGVQPHTSALMFFPPVSRAQSSVPSARQRVSRSSTARCTQSGAL